MKFAPVWAALCLVASQAIAQPAATNDIWTETTTYICTIDRPSGAMTLLALQTSGSQSRINIRIMGLNGWPEEQVSAKATKPIVAPIPPFEGGFSHLANFEASIAGRPYRFHITVSFVPLLRAHRPIEMDGKLLTNRYATLSISAPHQSATSHSDPIGNGYCEAQKDDGVFGAIG